MSKPSIAYINSNYRSILFRGFHFLPENAAEGWVYWLPQYILKNTSLQVYFLTNSHELFLLNRNETLQKLEPESLDSIDIFFGRTAGGFDPQNRLIQSAKLKIVYPLRSNAPESYNGHNIIVVHDDAFIKPLPEHDRSFFYCDSTKKRELLSLSCSLHKTERTTEVRKTNIEAGTRRNKNHLLRFNQNRKLRRGMFPHSGPKKNRL